MANDQYRFDDAYESVYELNSDAYVFVCKYVQANIRVTDSEKTMIKKMDEYWSYPDNFDQ